jgi:polyisoprenoid-binding protein YceI
MLKKVVIGLPVAGVVLVVALAAAWWFFVREDAQLATEPPAIPASLSNGDADNGPSLAGVSADGASGSAVAYTVISESSEAAYFADEQLASIGVPSTAKGATNAVAGTFYLTGDGWSLDTAQPSTFTVDLTTLESGEDRRDNRVQEALETGVFPSATFTVTGISGVDSSLDPGEQQTFQMTGMLDLHGVQKEITWDVEARREGNVITALATTNFLYEDFGVPILNIAGFVSVEDDVTLQMQIIAQAA